jgi:prepilin-type N-terminal cleavage/methylation domain-containing protein
MRKRLGNKGFSLVEVLIGVTILAIIAVPLAHAFITSAKTSVKAQNIRSETIAAQNILETYEATDIAAIVASGANTFAGCTIETFEAKDENAVWASVSDYVDLDTEGPGYRLTLSGVQVDGKFYDAILTVEANAADTRYGGLNEQEVVHSKPMSAVFNQPNDNPDVMAAEQIALLAQIDLIEMLEAEDGEGEPVEVPELTYLDFIAGMEREITITIDASGKCDALFSYHAGYNGNTYDVPLPYMIPGDPYKEDVDYGLYIFYYPNQNPAPGTDKIFIHNEHNREMNIYLVRQRIKDNPGYNPDANLPEVTLYELGKSRDDDSSAMLYINFETTYTYYFTDSWKQPPIKCDGTLGGKAAENRIYRVSVDLYEHEKAGDPDALLLQMDASSLE